MLLESIQLSTVEWICKFIYPRLSSRGVIVADDYGFKTCPGAKQAFKDFFKNLPEPIIELPTGQALIFKL